MCQRLEDQDIIKSCLAGNKDDFAKLINKYKKPILNLAFRLTFDTEEANDLAQETFIKAYASLKKFNLKKSFFSWLYTICLNLWKDSLKRKKIKSFSFDAPLLIKNEEEVSVEIPDSTKEPGVLAERHQRELEVIKQINSLPEKYQKIVVLYHLEELSYEEISSILKIPVGTVKVRLHRAREMLKSKLHKILEEGVE